MKYKDSTSKIPTATKILKVDHAGEFGAVNIYRAQIFVSRLFRRKYTDLLVEFLEDEKRHMETFRVEIERRKGIKCKSFWLCGIGGYFMGFVSALLGKPGIMSCTYAVESIVTMHLEEQLIYLERINDKEAYDAVHSILEDEIHHRDIGQQEAKDNFLTRPMAWAIRTFTEGIIRFGMR